MQCRGLIQKSAIKDCFLALSILVLFLPAATVNAGDDSLDLYSMSLQELMSMELHSATFFYRTTTESPGYSWIMTNQEIRDSSAVYIKDFFDFYAPATTISQTHFSGATTGVRGIATSNNAKTIFMYNGQSLNQKSHYGYQVGLESVLYGDIDRIEIINGPGAMLHGSGAINGIVNFISKNGQDNPGFHSSVEYGLKEDLRKFDIGYGEQYGNNNSYYVYAGIARADGFKPDSYLELGDRHSPGLDPNLDQNFKTYQLFDNYRLSSYVVHNDWEFQAQFQHVERSLNGRVELDDSTPNRRHWQTLLALRAKYTWQIDADTSIDFVLPGEFFDHGINFTEEEGDKGAREKHYALITTLHQVWDDHLFAVGFGLERRDFDPQKQYFESDKPLLEESMDGNLVETEIFSEDIWQINEKLSLLLGLRFDNVHYSTLYDPESGVRIEVDNLSAFTKRVAINRQIDEKRTIKLSYQEGFRYPDISYYLYLGIINDAFAKADLQKLPELEEETVKSYEINYLHELQAIPMTWDLNIYYNIHKGTLDWQDYSEALLGTERFNVASAAIDFDAGSFTNAVGTYNAYGFEIVNRWLPSQNTLIRASYGFSRPSGFDRQANHNLALVNGANDRWASYPEHLFKLMLNQKISRAFTLNISTYFASSVDICVIDCDGVETAAEKFHDQDRVRVNGKLQYAYDSNTTVALTVHNLFEDDGPAVGNESRGGTGALGGLGDDARRIYLGVKVNL